MLVKKWMSTKIVPIDENDTIQDTFLKFWKNNVSILPVIKADKLIGIMSDHGFRRLLSPEGLMNETFTRCLALSKLKVRKCMIKNPTTVRPDYSIEETAELLLKNDLYGTAVVNRKGHIEGIITQPDLLKVLISLAGGGIKGVQYAFLLKDIPGSIKEVTDIIRAYGGRIASILTSHSKEGKRLLRNAYIKIYNIESNKLNDLQAALREKVVILYMINYQTNSRNIYVSEQL